jgi:hypothetical protein
VTPMHGVALAAAVLGTVCPTAGCRRGGEQAAAAGAGATGPAAGAAQRVEEPTDADRRGLEAQRAVFTRLAAAAGHGGASLATAAGTLRALQAVLDAKTLRTDQTYELQCLGIALGDAFAERHGWQWVTVEDEHGRDPALRAPGTTQLVFPRTMISKRVERGEAVDVAALFDGIAGIVAQPQRR